MTKFEQLIEDSFRANYKRVNCPTSESQLWKNEWWSPIHGPETLEKMFEDLKLRISEIRANNNKSKKV